MDARMQYQGKLTYNSCFAILWPNVWILRMRKQPSSVRDSIWSEYWADAKILCRTWRWRRWRYRRVPVSQKRGQECERTCERMHMTCECVEQSENRRACCKSTFIHLHLLASWSEIWKSKFRRCWYSHRHFDRDKTRALYKEIERLKKAF